jgi:Tfp pilus assembly protein PilN
MVGVNLIPVSVRLSQVRRRHVRRWAVSVAVGVALVGVSLGMDWLRRAEAAGLCADNERLQSELEAIRADLKSVSAQAAETLLRIERAKALRSKRAWSGMIAMIASCMPPQSWLTSIATDPATPPAGTGRSQDRGKTEAEKGQQAVTIDAPRRLRISGYAPDAADPHEFVTKLKATELFTVVALEQSQREPVSDGWYIRFELVCEW